MHFSIPTPETTKITLNLFINKRHNQKFMKHKDYMREDRSHEHFINMRTIRQKYATSHWYFSANVNLFNSSQQIISVMWLLCSRNLDPAEKIDKMKNLHMLIYRKPKFTLEYQHLVRYIKLMKINTTEYYKQITHHEKKLHQQSHSLHRFNHKTTKITSNIYHPFQAKKAISQPKILSIP